MKINLIENEVDLMELIYFWTENFRNIYNTGFNFSKKYHVEFETESSKLKINQNENSFNIFDDKIQQITAIIGKNGSGKTNILDILGAKRESRLSLGNYKKLKYFFLYHLHENMFAIEGSNFELIKYNIQGFEGLKNLGPISEPYSIIVEKINDTLFSRGYLQNTKGIDFFSFRHRYNGETFKHIYSMKIENEHSSFFNRINLSSKNTGTVAIYQMVSSLNKKKSKEFSMFNYRNDVQLTITPSMHINEKIDLEINKGFNERSIFFEEKNNKFNNKDHFIHHFLYSLCHSLASQFILLPKMEIDYINIVRKLQRLTVKNENFLNYYFRVIEILLDYHEKNDKYFKDKQQALAIIKDFTNKLCEFNLSWFKEEKEIIIPLYADQGTTVKEFLLLYDQLEHIDDELQSLVQVFSINFSPFSAGEEALMSLFASLHHGLTLNYNREKETAIILLDEPDNFMHPEWSRLLISELCQFLNNVQNGYKNYQLIITTHSPFIVSDLPKDNIIALDKDDDTGKCTIEFIEESFASNIHTLFAQEFFMKSTIGEFAKNKINHVIDLLNNTSESIEDRQRIEYIINIIGEPIIKNKLKLMAEKTLWKERTIEQLKARLVELESNDTNQK